MLLGSACELSWVVDVSDDLKLLELVFPASGSSESSPTEGCLSRDVNWDTVSLAGLMEVVVSVLWEGIVREMTYPL